MTRLGQILVRDEMNKGIRLLVEAYRGFGALKEEAVQKISKEFDKTQEEAKNEVEKYW